MVFDRVTKFFFGKRIENVVCGQPRTPSLQDAVLEFFKVRSVVSVGVDHDLDAAVPRQAKMDVVQIKAVGVGVQFHRHLILAGSLQDGFEIKLIGFAAQLQSTRGMPKDRRHSCY